jgi:thymidine kinase
MAKLYFYYSAMNAGKSTTLLQSAHNYEERGMKVLIFTPNIDDRCSVGTVASRIGLKREACSITKDDDLFLQVRNANAKEQASGSKISCVLVDEAQFLTPTQVLQLTLVADQLTIPVLCYGIRTDFRGEPFEGSIYLLAWADELIEIKTICHSGKKATMNARIDAEGNRVLQGEQIQIGTNYVSLSRKEFELHRVTPIEYEIPQETEPEDAP